MIYSNKAKDYLSGLYYLVLWKSYPKKENMWEPVSIILQLCKIIGTFYLNYLTKLIVTFLLIDSTLSMARPIVKLREEILNTKALTKQKYGQFAKANGISKYTKKSWTFSFDLLFSFILIANKIFQSCIR